jgi:YgiT-type zinc finger domain-containing protein
MECMHCRGRMIRGTAPFSLDRNGYHVSWDAIPAWVCSQCGEPFLAKNMESENNFIRLAGESTRSLRRSYGKT